MASVPSRAAWATQQKAEESTSELRPQFSPSDQLTAERGYRNQASLSLLELSPGGWAREFSKVQEAWANLFIMETQMRSVGTVNFEKRKGLETHSYINIFTVTTMCHVLHRPFTYTVAALGDGCSSSGRWLFLIFMVHRYWTQRGKRMCSASQI
jgi:hypothetical protein